MSGQKGHLAHCHRCVYTWKVRRQARPALCPRCKSRLWDVPKVRPVVLGEGQGINEVIGAHRRELLLLASRCGARSVRVFGSVRRAEANNRSDLDLLVVWDHKASLLDVARFRIRARELLHRQVDVIEESRLHWAVRPQVIQEAVPL